MSEEYGLGVEVACAECATPGEVTLPTWLCGDCKAEPPDFDDLEFTRVVDVVELEALVEKWRAEYHRRKNQGAEERAWGIGHSACADDLQELIDGD